MSDKFLNETGLAQVASNVNTRLKTVTEMPATANEGAVRLYVGESDLSYTKGHVYQAKVENAYCFTAPDSGGTTLYIYLKQLQTMATAYSGSASFGKATGIEDLIAIPEGLFEIISVDENSLVISDSEGEHTFTRSLSDDLIGEFAWVDITPSGPSGAKLNINPTAEQIASYPDGAVWLEVEG